MSAIPDFQKRRRAFSTGMQWLCALATLLALVPLASLILYVIFQGAHRLDLDFFIHLPRPVGIPGGGMANAIVGTLTMVAIAFCIGAPVGVLAAVYLAEFGRGRIAFVVRFMADVLSGVPSIVTGIFTYAILVKPLGGFSALAGGAALGFMMIPIITRTTEELIRLVPKGLWEASLALGVTRWRTIVSIILKTAQSGILTGFILAGARVAGETAPLLFTAFSNQFWATGLRQPTASLTAQIYTLAISPFDEWHDQAWTGALVLLMLVLAVSLMARVFLKNPGKALQ
jgi:phosphate transport system permease protein